MKYIVVLCAEISAKKWAKVEKQIAVQNIASGSGNSSCAKSWTSQELYSWQGDIAKSWFDKPVIFAIVDFTGVAGIPAELSIVNNIVQLYNVSMKIIADTNIFLAVALEEKSKDRNIHITQNCDIYAPEILFYEVGNALSAMVKRRQIAASSVNDIYLIINQIPVSLVKVDISSAITIAVQQKIYAYDAYFLQIALAYSRPLMTLDHRLKTVAQSLNIEIKE